MAIYLCGDIHGTYDIQKLMRFFSVESYNDESSETNYLILLGDVGVCWDGGEKDQEVLEILSELPVDFVLFIDGNHENFDILNNFPVKQWKGGMIHEIESNILHLMRGQVFKIDRKRFFTFGGATSIDKSIRTEGINWWPEELPNEEEYERGMDALEEYDYAVDYILTHTAPTEVVYEMGFYSDGYEDEEELRNYLQEIAENTDFKEWYFGHFHRDESIDETYFCLFDRIVKLK